MFTSAVSVLLTLQVITIKSENCVTPNNEQGNCVSLYTCPKLISLLANQQKTDIDYVRKSSCGTTVTEPLLTRAPAGTCLTPNKKDGKCISLKACPELIKTLKTQRADSIDYVRKSTCEITSSDAFVCCPSESPHKQGEDPSQKQNDVLFPSRRYCGYQHSDDYESKVRGTDITEFPWLAGLYYKLEDGLEKVKCQGTIINARYILTAAHCVENRTDMRLKSIRLGEYNIKNSTDCVENWELVECSDPVQEYSAEEIFIHPQYKPKNPYEAFDIALLRLNQTIETYSDYIRPICLPISGTETLKPGDRLITTGWGTSASGPNVEIKKKVLNKLITNEECVNLYNINLFRISENQMCTQELSDSIEFSCSGDSGGPVMFSHNSQWYIEGINSFGSTKCGSKYPVVHTRVSRYLKWIRESMRSW